MQKVKNLYVIAKCMVLLSVNYLVLKSSSIKFLIVFRIVDTKDQL